MNKYWGHFKTVCFHKHYVFRACCKCGIGFQGLFHDMSKFSPEEFFTSAKYYKGTRSPIAEERDLQGFSFAWQHHKGRNKHHWEYWADFRDDGSIVYGRIPIRYVKEMLCDWIGAGKAYNRGRWDHHYPLRYFKSHETYYHLHPDTKAFLMHALQLFEDEGEDAAFAWVRAQKNY